MDGSATLDAIEANISRFRLQFDRWAGDQADFLDGSMMKHLDLLDQLEEQHEGALDERDALAKVRAAQAEQEAKCRAKLQELQAEIDQLEQQRQAHPEQAANLQAELRQNAERIQAGLRGVAQLQQETQHVEHTLTTSLLFFQHRLGLSLQPREDCIAVKFRHLAPAGSASGSTATFELGVDDAGNYTVRNPQPALPRKVMERVAVLLGQPSGLTAAFCLLRRAFKRQLAEQ